MAAGAVGGGEMAGLKKAGSNWVEGEYFFDREAELEVLRKRVRNGIHTLLTAQRRMGKTSLVRELLRRLRHDKAFETVFVDLEAADSAADAIAEIGSQSRHVQGAWRRIKSVFSNALNDVAVEELSVYEVRVKLRAGVDAGNWRQKGDEICAALFEERAPRRARDRRAPDSRQPHAQGRRLPHHACGEARGRCIPMPGCAATPKNTEAV